MRSLATKSITGVGVSGNDLRLPRDELIRLYANFRSPRDSEKSRTRVSESLDSSRNQTGLRPDATPLLVSNELRKRGQKERKERNGCRIFSFLYTFFIFLLFLFLSFSLQFQRNDRTRAMINGEKKIDIWRNSNTNSRKECN